MNIHHLELFYYVARHGGIAAAVRRIPYGIQQPAVSGQIAQLEEGLGARLFHRRPFALTPEGERLFAFIEPFFGGLQSVEEGIQGRAVPQIRLAAPAIVLTDYLPGVLRRVRERRPQFRLHLHDATQLETARLLEARAIDMAVMVLEEPENEAKSEAKSATKRGAKSGGGIGEKTGLHTRPLASFPLTLLLPKKHPVKTARELWERDSIDEPLIAFPPGEPLYSCFQRGLAQRGAEWFPSMEVSSLRLVERYVADGFGIGLGLAVPGVAPLPGVRTLPLDDFPRLTFGAVWIGELPPIAREFLEEAEAEARRLKS